MVNSEQKPLLRVYIQTILDREPYYYRAYRVDISDHGVNFTCPDTNCNYLFDFVDVVKITPDCEAVPLDDIEQLAQEELEHLRPACLECAYNDNGSCFCSEKKSVCCPYAKEDEEDVTF